MIIIGHDDMTGEAFKVTSSVKLVGVLSICKAMNKDMLDTCDVEADYRPIYELAENKTCIPFIIVDGVPPRRIIITGIAYAVGGEEHKPTVDMSGKGKYAFTVLCLVVMALQEDKIPKDKIRKYIKEAMHKGYNDLIKYSKDYCNFIW